MRLRPPGERGLHDSMVSISGPLVLQVTNGSSESCDNWLHAQCVNIDRRGLPPVYVCAFCAQTPNMRGGRIRDPARGTAHLASSPLAHKSFRSFR